jgi:hypothetical protein
VTTRCRAALGLPRLACIQLPHALLTGAGDDVLDTITARELGVVTMRVLGDADLLAQASERQRDSTATVTERLRTAVDRPGVHCAPQACRAGDVIANVAALSGVATCERSRTVGPALIETARTLDVGDAARRSRALPCRTARPTALLRTFARPQT